MNKVKIKSIKKIEHDSRRYDIGVKNNHNFFANNILVHNSFTQFALWPESWADGGQSRFIISSKGLAKRGIAIDWQDEENENNIYCRVARALGIEARMLATFLTEMENQEPVYVLGESFGSGVQDLHYGASAAKQETLGFRVFDIYVGQPAFGRYLDDAELNEVCYRLRLERVPVLYHGPYSKLLLQQFTSGKEEVSGKGLHIREGIVVCPMVERRDSRAGRVKFKSVSEKYLLRKDGTEHN